jgi:hypothetical protein
MKVISASSLDCERPSSAQKNKNATALSPDDSSSKFKLALRDLKSTDLQSEVLEVGLDAACVSDEESASEASADIEALVVAPVNNASLVEGYEMFGSIFSMLEEQLIDEGKAEAIDTEILPQEEVKRFLNFEVLSHAVEPKEYPENKSIVIDLPLWRKGSWNPTGLTHMSNPRQPTLDKRVSKITPNESLPMPSTSARQEAKILELRLNNVERSDRLFESMKSSADISFEDTSALSLSLLQQSSSLRIEQIVQAVAERQVALATSSALQKHAGLTGQSLRLSLHPSELGAVDVTIVKRGKRLHVTLSPERESAGRVLAKEAELLLKRLGLANADAEHVQVQIITREGVVDIQSREESEKLALRPDVNSGTFGQQNTSPRAPSPRALEGQKTHELESLSHPLVDDIHRTHNGIYI